MAKITFDDLVAEVQETYRAVEFELADGTVVNLRALAILPREARKLVIAAVKVVNDKKSDVDAQETAVDHVLCAVSDNASALTPALDALPLGAKLKLVQMWAEGTQAPEA
ncbi:tape measure chaperone [Streptomyces phage Shady]|uniref:Tape measure chaperone n=1 Tax=Streptomyces phage Shady TaxID=2767585 RepID=A0A873WLB7_9CAUD|nr:tape measure chaperone [Streptomyces phage Shady]